MNSQITLVSAFPPVAICEGQELFLRLLITPPTHAYVVETWMKRYGSFTSFDAARIFFDLTIEGKISQKSE